MAGRLSKREREVLAQVAEGKGRSGISQALGIAESTVRTRLDGIKDRLELPKGATTDDVRAAARAKGLID